MALKNILNVSKVRIINFLKIEMKKMKPNIKIIRNYLRLLKNFSKSILTFKYNIKKTWEVIEDSVRKGKCNNQTFSKKLIIDNIAITDETQIAENFNSFFYRNWSKTC